MRLTKFEEAALVPLRYVVVVPGYLVRHCTLHVRRQGGSYFHWNLIMTT